jgi:hypothetical protein
MDKLEVEVENCMSKITQNDVSCLEFKIGWWFKTRSREVITIKTLITSSKMN